MYSFHKTAFKLCNRSRVQRFRVQRLTDSGAEKVNESYAVEKIALVLSIAVLIIKQKKKMFDHERLHAER
jgi:hypothetical protein